MTTPHELSRRDRVTALLEHYLDVLHGLQDGPGADDLVIGMCAAWNHPSYRELERLRLELRATDRTLYAPLSAMYFRCTLRRMMRCIGEERGRRCEYALSAAEYARRRISPLHQHSRRAYRLHPTLERVPAPGVDLALLPAAVAWIDEHFTIDPSIPPDLLGVKAAA